MVHRELHHREPLFELGGESDVQEDSTEESTKDCSLIVYRLLESREEFIFLLKRLQPKTDNEEKLARD